MSDEDRERSAILAQQSRILDDGRGRVDSSKLPDVLEFAGVPKRLQSSTWRNVDPANPEMRAANAAAKTIVSGNGGGLHVGVLIVGLHRSGKSSLAAALLSFAAFRGKTIAWRTAEDLAASNYETVRGGEHEQAQADDEKWRLQHVIEVLVIDNLDLLALTEFTARHILSIIRARADNGLVTIITQPPLGKASSDAFEKAATLPARSIHGYVASAMIRVKCERVS